MNSVGETTVLIDLVLAHRKDYVQDFLESAGFPTSGTKEDLRERLKNLVDRGDITKEELVSLLDEIEIFGNQHIYLFRIPDSHLQKLRDPNYVKNICEKNGMKELYNNYKPLILPEESEIASIYHDNDWLSIRWVAKKEKLQLMEQSDSIDDEGRRMLIKKYLVREFRATTLFRVSLITGDADLLIHRYPSLDYNQEKDNYLLLLDSWFGWGMLNHENLHPTIMKIENSKEVRIRNVGLITPKGSHIGIASSSTGEGIHNDPEASRIRKSGRTSISNKGNFYWLPEKTKKALTREIHTLIHRDRVVVYGECREEELNYVLGRIRNFI